MRVLNTNDVVRLAEEELGRPLTRDELVRVQRSDFYRRTAALQRLTKTLRPGIEGLLRGFGQLIPRL